MIVENAWIKDKINKFFFCKTVLSVEIKWKVEKQIRDLIYPWNMLQGQDFFDWSIRKMSYKLA